MPGWRRLRRGRGFSYLDEYGNRLDDLHVVRIKELVIPPAWTDVWICPLPNGHLQAVGTDAAGRRQYLYHPDWRVQRDIEKFRHMEEFAAALIRRRPRVRRDLGGDDLGRERVLAAAVGLLDLGMFRIGSDQYAEDNGSYGLTTLEKQHVRPDGAGIAFEYAAKSGQQVEVTVRDRRVVEVLSALRARRSGPQRLMAYRDGADWRDVTAAEVNDYIRDTLEGEYTAKDFRTWRANVIAAWFLAEAPAASKTARTKSVSAAMRTVSEHLGNTPAVARSSYVDPRVVDLFGDGVTVEGTYRNIRPGHAVNRTLEKRVLALLRG